MTTTTQEITTADAINLAEAVDCARAYRTSLRPDPMRYSELARALFILAEQTEPSADRVILAFLRCCLPRSPHVRRCWALVDRVIDARAEIDSPDCLDTGDLGHGACQSCVDRLEWDYQTAVAELADLLDGAS